MVDVSPVARLVATLSETNPALPDGPTPDDIVAWCRCNKYPLLALARVAPPWLSQQASVTTALAAEQAWYETQRAEYLLVREAWLRQGINCLMIKSAGNAPSFPHTSDNIDILVRPAQGAMARDTLRRLGYIEVRNVEEPQKHLFRRFHDGQCVSAIHVHERVAWLVGFMDEAALWERSRPAADDPLVTIPSPEDTMLINLAHACYENKRLRFNDLARVRHALCATAGTPDWAYLKAVAAARGWLDGLAFMLLVYAWLEPALFGSSLMPAAEQEAFAQIIRGDAAVQRRLQTLRQQPAVDLPLDLSYWFCKRLYYRKILADPVPTPAQRWRDVGVTLLWGVKLKSGIRPQPGMVVSLSGLDGSGKTTHARALVDAFRLCEIRADYVWSRGGSSGLLRLARRLRGQPREAPAAPTTNETDHLALRRRRLAHPVVRVLWSWLVAIDQIGTYLLRVRLPALAGRVVVADRYVYDTAVEMGASVPADDRWSQLAIATMLRLAPRPRCAYLIDIAPDTARARHGDGVWPEALAAARGNYLALAKRAGLRVLANEGAFAAANDALVHDVMMDYMAGFETRLNALFLGNPSQKNVPDVVWARGRAPWQTATPGGSSGDGGAAA